MRCFKRAVLIVLMCLISALPSECLCASSGGSGGNSGGGSKAPVSVSVTEYRVSGTISLPDGFTAPEGGLKVYGGFGSVSFGEISAFSDNGTETAEYEKFDIVAVIPCGGNSVLYKYTFNMPSDLSGFYGGFWIYSSSLVSDDGTQYLSNKIATSDIVKTRTGVTEYSGVDAMLATSDETLSYTVNFSEDLQDEKPNQTIYVIADDGCDKYVTKQDFNNCNESFGGILRVEKGGYTLSYYIPSTTACENQRLETGPHTLGEAYSDRENRIFVNSRSCITGTVIRPEYDDFHERLSINIATSAGSVKLHMGSGEDSVQYTVAANRCEDEFLNVQIISDYYCSGYFDGEQYYEEACAFWDFKEFVKKIDIPLKMRCMVLISADVPSPLEMQENTFFPLYVRVENTKKNFSDTITYFKFSDENSYQAMYVPYENKDDEFTVSYSYGDYTSVEIPAYAKNPLKMYPRNSTIGGGNGGGGKSTIGIGGYKNSIPDGLLCNYRIYVNSHGGTLYRDEAQKFKFDDLSLSLKITLAKEGAMSVSNIVGGYFCDVVSHGKDAQILLLDAESKDVKYKTDLQDEKYVFKDIADGKYIISAFYDGKNHYYNGVELTGNIADAKITDTAENPISYGNDMYFDNIFPTDIKCVFAGCYVNGILRTADIGIYDIYGNKHLSFNTDDIIAIPFSPFIMRVNGEFVSGYVMGKRLIITGTAPDFKQAKEINAEYRNTLGRPLANYSDVDILTAEIEQPQYSVTDVRTDEGYVVCELSKNFDGENPPALFYALYDAKGNLKRIIRDAATSDKGTRTVRSSKPLCADVSDGERIRVFVWGENLVPLCK